MVIPNPYRENTVRQLKISQDLRPLSIASPALEFFIDFDVIQPIIIDADTPAIDLHKLMSHARFSLPILVEEGERFIGVLNRGDISERRIIQKVSKSYGRQDVSVRDLMQSTSNLSMLSYHDVAKSSIARIVQILKHVGQHECLVLDEESEKIRGMFSANDLSRKLGLHLDIHDTVNFYRIFLALTHQDLAAD